MRPELLEPAGGYTPDVVSSALILVGVVKTPADVEPWTKLERAIAYDWSIREHLGASDNLVRRRDKPTFLGGQR